MGKPAVHVLLLSSYHFELARSSPIYVLSRFCHQQLPFTRTLLPHSHTLSFPTTKKMSTITKVTKLSVATPNTPITNTRGVVHFAPQNLVIWDEK